MAPMFLRKFFGWFFLVVTIGLPGLSASAQEGDFLAVQRRVTEIYGQHVNAVVRVKAAVEEVEEDGDPAVSLRVGTGFIISLEGHVLTNSSVALGADRVWVELDGVPYAADHLGSDPKTNLSLLKLMVLPEKFSHIPVPSAVSMPALGSLVVAITCPLEFDPSPALGMVTGRESSFSQRVFPVTYVRVDVPAHPGEGGAPVLDLNGRLVGILVASLPEVRSSYLLPSRAILRIRDDLLFSGSVEYGWIGMELEERVDRELGRHILIGEVVEGTPAAEAGLREGDRLVRMGDVGIRLVDDVRTANFYHRVGDFVDLEVERDGKVLGFSVQMVRREGEER